MHITPDITSIIVALLTSGCTLIGIMIKDGKKDAVREAKEDARFEKLETSIQSNQRQSEMKSDYVVKEIKSDIRRLEEKQEKYNNLQERTMKTEQSIKSFHHRLDNMERGRRSHEESDI